MLPVQKHLLGNTAGRSGAGRRRRTKKQNPDCPAYFAANGFLKQTFYPLSAVNLPAATRRYAMEQSFFQSLQYVTDLYHLQLQSIDQLPYPVNIWKAYRCAQRQLTETDADLKLIIGEINKLPVLCTAKVLNTGHHLYYIPLYPLYDFIITKNKGDLAKLLLSAFSYLYHVGVPLCDSSSFVGYQMEMVEESLLNEPPEGETSDNDISMEQIQQVTSQCRMLNKKIKQKQHVKQFEKRLKNIQSDCPKEKTLIAAIGDVYDLYINFSRKKFNEQVITEFIEPATEERVSVEQYLSFYWGGDSEFDKQVNYWIDATLQEVGIAEEPVAVQLFDHPHAEAIHDLNFERLFLQTIIKLNEALYAF